MRSVVTCAQFSPARNRERRNDLLTIPGLCGEVHLTANYEKGNWRADRLRFGRGAWLIQPAFLAVSVYRFGRWTIRAPRLVRPAMHAIYFVAYSVVRLATGIDIPRGSRFGPGLLIHHFGGIIIHPGSQVGANCTMRHGVTIGAKEGTGAPVLGDGVKIGAYAQILGDVTIGHNASIGALTLVLRDVPDGATAVGIPARIVSDRPPK